MGLVTETKRGATPGLTGIPLDHTGNERGGLASAGVPALADWAPEKSVFTHPPG